MKTVSKRYRLTIVVIALGIASIYISAAYRDRELQIGKTPAVRAISDYASAKASKGKFSGVIEVSKNGELLLERGYGYADSSRKIVNTPQTKFCIASVGKLFTAVAIAQLVEQGKLSFNTPIGMYISGFSKEIANSVTIADLLDMTGGFGNAAPVTASRPLTLTDLMKPIFTETLLSKPGSTFNYSNDGYIVLGAIIQRVSGESYAAYIQQHIFTPAGMHDTEINAYKPAEVAGMAHGYTNQNGQFTDISNLYQIANPSGGAYSTAADLLKFAQALMDHKLLSPAMTTTVLLPRVDTPQPGGPSVDEYTYGFAYQKYNGVPFVGHNGGTAGYEDQLDMYPSKGYAVVVLTNQDGSMVPVIRNSEKLLTQ